MRNIWEAAICQGRESYFFRYRLLVMMWFLSEGFKTNLCAWDKLQYFIVAFPDLSIKLFCSFLDTTHISEKIPIHSYHVTKVKYSLHIMHYVTHSNNKAKKKKKKKKKKTTPLTRNSTVCKMILPSNAKR